MKNILFVLVSLSMCFVACKKETINYTEVDEQLIQDYLSENNLTAESTEEGIYYVIEEEGTGDYPYLSSTVTVNYEGFLLDGTKFDSSLDSGQPLIIKLNSLIAGWQIGMSFFREGSKGKLFIPSGYGYGSSTAGGSLPANSVLIFDIHLINIDNGDYTEVDEFLIQSYLIENNLTAESTSEGVYYIIEEEGTGVQADSSSMITVDYEGFLLDGTKFDSSYDNGMPSTFSTDDIIQGWQIGIRLFKEGGTGTLIIPSRYAYANNSPLPDIPPNSVLLFNIELLDVQ